MSVDVLDRLLKFEEQLVRLEALLLVVFVLLMLALATYNVFYRNVLVPIQVSLITEPAPSTDAAPIPETATPEPAEQPDPAGGFGGGFGDQAAGEGAAPEGAEGFGGDFDAPAADAPAPAPPSDSADGFGGDFGEPAPPKAEPTEPAPTPPADAADGFGGDFGAPAAGTTGTSAPADDSGGFGGDFATADAAQPTTEAAAPVAAVATAEPEREIPAFAKFVDAVKIEWIDVLLRQLVLIVGFLGAMMATRRRKHITIDALSKVLPPGALHWIHVVTNTISIVVCAFLAKAGADLVAISLEFPKELVSWADEWHFQLAFPIGFGLLVVHFMIRLIESFLYATGRAEPPPGYLEAGGAA